MRVCVCRAACPRPAILAELRRRRHHNHGPSPPPPHTRRPPRRKCTEPPVNGVSRRNCARRLGTAISRRAPRREAAARRMRRRAPAGPARGAPGAPGALGWGSCGRRGGAEAGVWWDAWMAAVLIRTQGMRSCAREVPVPGPWPQERVWWDADGLCSEAPRRACRKKERKGERERERKRERKR